MVSNIVIIASACLVATPAGALDESGTATLSLDEVLRLHRLAESESEEGEGPPVAHSVSSFDARAKIIGDAVEATVSFRLSVFEDGWVSVPLLERDPELDVTELPVVEDGYFVAKGGALDFVTETAGDYRFQIGILKRAAKRGGSWEVLLKPAEATIQRLQLTHDEGLFEVASDGARREGDTLIVFARNGRLRLTWKALRTPASTPQRKRERPPIEPVVTSASASIVVTLDGQRITRILYRLRFQGTQTIKISVPDEQKLTKVYLNGMSQPFELNAGQAGIPVTPPRLGDQSAVVEVVIEEQTAPMALAGALSFVLPKLSWGINEMECTLFLPDVFNYSWVGGSLSPGDVGALSEYTFDIPTPGKMLSVKQQLVNGAPNTVVEYAVDLAGNYFH